MKVDDSNKKGEILKAYKESEEEKSSMMEQMQAMMQQMNEMKEQMNSKPVVIQAEPTRQKIRSVKLMSLSIGQCYLVDGSLNMKFDKAFDQIPIIETKFQDFYYRFKEWFDDLEIIILDDDIAEEYGMKVVYDKHKISETFMAELIKMKPESMIEHLSTLIPKLQLVFVKYFAGEVAKENVDAMNSNKHYALQKYILENFHFEINIEEISKQIK